MDILFSVIEMTAMEKPDANIDMYIVVGLRKTKTINYWKLFRGEFYTIEQAENFIQEMMKLRPQFTKFKIYQLK